MPSAIAAHLQSEDYAALLAGRCPPFIRADWLRDRGATEYECDEMGTQTPFHWLDIHRFLGIGIGRGRGSGSGSGSGSGRGIGRGSGSGSGSGSGIGIGRGRGSGSGRGSGKGKGTNIYPETGVMRIGQSYLVHLGDWHTFVGRVCDQLGPLTYEMEYASKVDIQNHGDRWDDLCAGDDLELRRTATYWHQKGKIVVPLSICAIEWFGDLMHPDAPKTRG